MIGSVLTPYNYFDEAILGGIGNLLRCVSSCSEDMVVKSFRVLGSVPRLPIIACYLHRKVWKLEQFRVPIVCCVRVVISASRGSKTNRLHLLISNKLLILFGGKPSLPKYRTSLFAVKE